MGFISLKSLLRIHKSFSVQMSTFFGKDTGHSCCCLCVQRSELFQYLFIFSFSCQAGLSSVCLYKHSKTSSVSSSSSSAFPFIYPSIYLSICPTHKEHGRMRERERRRNRKIEKNLTRVSHRQTHTSVQNKVVSARCVPESVL